MAEVSEAFRQACFDHYREHREEIIHRIKIDNPVEYLFLIPDLARIDQYLGISEREK
jgi:hypothetical protein